ncbi:hypothetical protein NHF46_09155 [Arthrobacter alpinus]|nr:hypothetical protein [Arthrobacter alpinus]
MCNPNHAIPSAPSEHTNFRFANASFNRTGILSGNIFSRARRALPRNENAVVPGARNNNRASNTATSAAVALPIDPKVAISSLILTACRQESSPASKAPNTAGRSLSNTTLCSSNDAALGSGIPNANATSVANPAEATPR